MQKSIIFTEMKTVVDAQVVLLNSVTLHASQPFQGFFEVYEIDTCSHVVESTGKRSVQVRCCWGKELDHENAYLEIECSDVVLNSFIGYEGEVVARMEWA